jgi:hypothetical protein
MSGARKKWKCSDCQYENFATVGTCAMCDTPKDGQCPLRWHLDRCRRRFRLRTTTPCLLMKIRMSHAWRAVWPRGRGYEARLAGFDALVCFVEPVFMLVSRLFRSNRTGRCARRPEAVKKAETNPYPSPRLPVGSCNRRENSGPFAGTL